MEAATIGAFDEVDRQIINLARAAAPSRAAATVAAIPPLAAAPSILIRNYIRHPSSLEREEARSHLWRTEKSCRPQRIAQIDRQEPRPALMAAGIFVAVLVFGTIAAALLLPFFQMAPLTGRAAVKAVVARIVAAESSGELGAKAKRSSAAGPAQFLDETWLELIRAYRPDLAKSRSREQLLDLRRDAGLARKIATRFAERNAILLARRGLPVTAGTLYLAHFAGAAGAVALLSAPDDADAASVMAKADSTGKTSRDQLVKANPFLDKFTVADIRRWADRKMAGRRLVLTDLLAAAGTK